jgi:hypothetical protein
LPQSADARYADDHFQNIEGGQTTTIRIELKPDEERALRERARLAGRDPVQYAHEVLRDHIGQVENARRTLPTLEDLMDHEFIAYCAREADDNVTLEEVLEATSKIKDSMARVIIEEERAERF